MDHRELDAYVALDLDRIAWRDMGGAAELKLILALADMQLGLAGRRTNRSRACAGVRPPFRRLQSMQLHTTFSHVVRPPSERGIT